MENESIVQDGELTEGDENSRLLQFYQIGVPIILVVCVLTFVVNILIVVSSRWMRRPLTPTMQFSISLAGADAVASLIVGLGLVLNSLLPAVYEIYVFQRIPCTILTLEAFRLGAVLVTCSHLLALAVNHYIGIVRPLHYAAIVTKRTVTISIVAMWIGPNLAILTSFSTIENQGFQDSNCTSDFIQRIQFRGLYSSFFFAPLLAMIFIYGHIFIIIRRHQASRRALTQHISLNSLHGSRVNHSDNRYTSQPCSEHCRQVAANPMRWPSQRANQHASVLRSNRTVSSDPTDQSNSVTKNVKAAITTLFIVGTCILGWMPVVVWFILYCEDCTFKPEDIRVETRTAISLTVNTLIVLKFFLSPIIYTVRMKDFQLACRRMRYQLSKKCFPRCHGEPKAREDDATLVHMNRSLIVPSQALVPSNGQTSMRLIHSTRPVAKIKPVSRPELDGLTQSITTETHRIDCEDQEQTVIQIHHETSDSRYKNPSAHGPFDQSL